MKEKWNKKGARADGDGQPVAQKWAVTEPMYKPKLLHHSPSMKEAMKHYQDVPIDRTSQGNENLGYEGDPSYEYYVTPDYSISNGSDIKLPEYTSSYDYPTLGTSSTKTDRSGSRRNSFLDHNEMGSSVKLVTTKVEISCQSWCSHLLTTLCTLSMAANLGNLYRLPQTALIRGGLPFLVVYIVLTVIIGLPLLFLELGIGQMAQEGFIKSWRAVPFFKGIGYVKLLAGCFLSIYYPLYSGMAFIYLIWVLKSPIPFSECTSGVIITEQGYYAAGKSGQQCIRSTFIKSPFEDPYYFGIYTALLLFTWIIITILAIRRTKSYVKSLLILFFPTMACYIALMTKTIVLESEISVLHRFFHDADWSVLGKAEVWYYATLQVFFSTNIGFGSFITNAGILYHKVNPLWTALGFILANVVFGTGSILMTTILTGQLNNSFPEYGDIAEVKLFTLLYDAMRETSDNSFRFWIISFYGLVLFSTFSSMATLSYTILKTVRDHDVIGLKWWQGSVILSLTGLILGCLMLLRRDFDLVHLLDHYVVGNLVLICVILEVLALISFYGTQRILSDFEFMLGRTLSKIWLLLWWLIPLVLTSIFAWGLATLPLEGVYKDDAAWLYGIGWAVVLTAFAFIFVVGLYVISKQDGYTIMDKLKSSLEPSHNWGPKDPMLRHNWVQWNTKTQSGEKDFTLKRRGTKDYTRTIKKNAKKAASELSSGSVQGAYHKTDTMGREVANPNRLSNGSPANYYELYYVSYDAKNNAGNGGLIVETSLEDSLEPRINNHSYKGNRHTFPVNPLAYPADVPDANSEGYGTFRKGPYVIDGSSVQHVCHKRSSNP